MGGLRVVGFWFYIMQKYINILLQTRRHRLISHFSKKNIHRLCRDRRHPSFPLLSPHSSLLFYKYFNG